MSLLYLRISDSMVGSHLFYAAGGFEVASQLFYPNKSNNEMLSYSNAGYWRGQGMGAISYQGEILNTCPIDLRYLTGIEHTIILGWGMVLKFFSLWLSFYFQEKYNQTQSQCKEDIWDTPTFRDDVQLKIATPELDIKYN